MSSVQLMSHPSIVLPRLIGFLGAHASSNPATPPDHSSQPFDLFFPGIRLFACNQQNSPWSLLFRAMDRIPLDFPSTVVSAAASFELSKSYVKLPASIAYTLHHTLNHCLRPKLPREITDNRNLVRSFLRLVRQDQIQLAPFFHSSKISSLSPTSRVRQHRLSTRSYRRLCSLPPKPFPSLPSFALLTFVPLLIFVSLLLHRDLSAYPTDPLSSMIRHLPPTMLRKSIPSKVELHFFRLSLCSHYHMSTTQPT
ncbi:hypothetical protein MUCCIDRAFT_107713 [Mucor lusitanicus CBS 277.49]|uniref:Uncharacterized protein n=1 Tax=Mucor lusitanicus CBS 277.49 TaxID=747725 RepID=A0A162R0F6_MUCCL|nr:hypothetical protein MUCCIDRAFT_107713 [Mucor lusitanicus CBS 277.49]